MRVKPDLSSVYDVKTLEDADGILARIAELNRQMARINLKAAEEIDAIKARAAYETEPAKVEIAGLERSLGRFAEAEKEELFGKKKSLALRFGTIGFRASSKLRTRSKWTFERVLGALKERGMTAFIRVKEEVDKEKLKGLDPDKLAEVGCTVKTEDTFFYELPENEGEDG